MFEVKNKKSYDNIYQLTEDTYFYFHQGIMEWLSHVCSTKYLTTEWKEITSDKIINQFLTLTVKCPINYFCSPLKPHAMWHWISYSDKFWAMIFSFSPSLFPLLSSLFPSLFLLLSLSCLPPLSLYLLHNQVLDYR